MSDDRLVSASLDGDIRVWNTDSMTRGCALVISRRSDTFIIKYIYIIRAYMTCVCVYYIICISALFFVIIVNNVVTS